MLSSRLTQSQYTDTGPTSQTKVLRYLPTPKSPYFVFEITSLQVLKFSWNRPNVLDILARADTYTDAQTDRQTAVLDPTITVKSL